MRGNVASVRRLVKAGVGLDGADRLSDALWLAAKNGHDGVVTALALAGVDLDKPCTTGGSTPLLHAVHFGCIDTVRLLLQLGADRNATGTEGIWAGRTALEIAQRRSHLEELAALLRAWPGEPAPWRWDLRSPRGSEESAPTALGRAGWRLKLQ